MDQFYIGTEHTLRISYFEMSTNLTSVQLNIHNDECLKVAHKNVLNAQHYFSDISLPLGKKLQSVYASY